MPDTKLRLTEAATAFIQRQGPHGTTFRALGEALGIRSASVHYHFGSKQQLLHHVAVRYTAQFDATLAEYTGPDALVRLVALFEDVAHQGLVCLCGMLAAHPDELSSETRAHLTGWFDGLQGWIAAQLASRGRPEHEAPVVLAALEGALLLDRLESRTQRLRAVKRWIGGL